jgi:hypothetical protein
MVKRLEFDFTENRVHHDKKSNSLREISIKSSEVDRVVYL